MMLHTLSINQLHLLLRTRKITSVDITRYILDRIERYNPEIHAFICVTAERALKEAALADEEMARGKIRGPLHGIPYALKDIFDVRKVPTTCNSHFMTNYIPSKDATVVKKLKAAGGILVGKLATHEFALGGPSFELPFPPARNPWATDYFTGASSSGSGAAIAAGLSWVTLGTDTSGSIRGPASLCGTVGLKPTYGLISRVGVFPLSYSLDHCGLLTWTVEDAALALQVLAGHDAEDPSSAKVFIPDYCSKIGQNLSGLKMGYARRNIQDIDALSPEVLNLLDNAAQVLSTLGVEIEEIFIPHTDLFNACGRIIMSAEAYEIHKKRFKQEPQLFGRYTYQRILPGATLSAADLLQAFRVRSALTKSFNADFLTKYDAILFANNVVPAPKIDEFPLDWPPPKKLLATQTILFNVTGNPVLALPIGFSSQNLPIGMQIVGRLFEEPLLFKIGSAFEKNMQLTEKRPSL